jgi:8-oxo-dGTP pyrophosphatase MutT (NUDIX family)
VAEREFSAGGVVVRGEDVVVISPKRRGPGGRKVLGLPKGHPEGDESPPDTALREVREETGIDSELVEKLGDVHYSYRRKGRRIQKNVSFFLFRYAGGELVAQPEEIDDVSWMPLARAATELTFQGEREMAARALSRLRSDR